MANLGRYVFTDYILQMPLKLMIFTLLFVKKIGSLLVILTLSNLHRIL